jgi:hypothetical protein
MPRPSVPWAASFHAGSSSSSRPSSRASSPTRGLASTSRNDAVATPSFERLDDYFASHSVSSSTAATPATPYNDMWGGAQTPGVHGPVDIVLDSDHLVLRGYGSEFNSAYLSGRVELFLSESTNIKEINMTLVGKARVQFHDSTG